MSEMNEERRIMSEQVASVEAPPKARVLDQEQNGSLESTGEKLERKRDYPEGFLAQQPTPVKAVEPGGDTYDAIIDALKEIFDPEIPVNIYDLGLIYGVDVSDGGHAVVTMTLTTPHCPVAESMPAEVELRVGAIPGVGDVEVNLVWDPPWDPQKMSDEAKLELGML
jgi:FeS assembly SUF system protein